MWPPLGRPAWPPSRRLDAAAEHVSRPAQAPCVRPAEGRIGPGSALAKLKRCCARPPSEPSKASGQPLDPSSPSLARRMRHPSSSPSPEPLAPRANRLAAKPPVMVQPDRRKPNETIASAGTTGSRRSAAMNRCRLRNSCRITASIKHPSVRAA